MAAAEEPRPALDAEPQPPAKLCQECGKQTAKYCCPRCERRTCSLDCVKAHKEAAGCSGKRDRTGFVGRATFDERTLLSDYRFLEEVKLAEDVAKRAKPPAPKLELPQFLQTLQYQAGRRGVQLHILSPGMEKRRTNSTRYDGRTQTLHWHVEWVFPAAAGCKATDTKVHENTPISELLARHLALVPGAAAKHHALREHREAGAGSLTLLLRKERTPANAVLYHEIDASRPLRQQLAGKVLVEFPTFIVLLPREREAGSYHILPPAAAPAAANGAAAAAANGEGPAGDAGAAAAATAAPSEAAAAAGGEVGEAGSAAAPAAAPAAAAAAAAAPPAAAAELAVAPAGA